MKKVFMILILIISFGFITGCDKEETIKTYDDVEIIEKKEEEKEEEVEEDSFETLECRHLVDKELFVMFTITEEEGYFYLYITATKIDSDDIIWEYKTTPYELNMHGVGKYVSDPNNEEIVYILEEKAITVINLANGKVLWQNKDKVAEELNDGIIINDVLYAKVPWQRTIYAFNKNNGKKIKEIVIPEKYQAEAFNIRGAYNNNIIVECMTENGGFLLVNPNNNSISTMNFYLVD